MADKPKISILVPVYNGGEYLKVLVQNLQEQTLKEFEAVFVEDSSTDDSMMFLQNKAKDDARIKIIHRKEKGGTAVKGIVYGLPYCTGEYFFYMSQDDFIETDTLEKLYQTAIKTNADIVVPNIVYFYGDTTDQKGLYYSEKEITGKEAFLRSLSWSLHGFYLQKMEFAKKIGWDDLYYNSCEYATRIHYYYANRVVFCDTVFFYRQNNPHSITKTKIAPFKMEVMLTQLRVLNFMLENGFKKTPFFKNIFINFFIDYKHYSSYPVFNQLSDTEKDAARKILAKARIMALKIALKAHKRKFAVKSLLLFFTKAGTLTGIQKRKYKIWEKLNKEKIYKNDNSDKQNLFFELNEWLKAMGIIQPGSEADFYSKTKLAKSLNCKVGFGTYCSENVVVGDYRTEIGKFCSLAANIVIGAGEHPLNYLTTSPFIYMESLGYRKGPDEAFQEPVKVGNDVWIGDNVFIKGGVTIGDGAVIAAGAVVVKDVSPYAVVGGVPAKVIKYRFSEEVIQDLLELKWWDMDDEVIKSLPFHDVKKCIEILKARKKNEQK